MKRINFALPIAATLLLVACGRGEPEEKSQLEAVVWVTPDSSPAGRPCVPLTDSTMPAATPRVPPEMLWVGLSEHPLGTQLHYRGNTLQVVQLTRDLRGLRILQQVEPLMVMVRTHDEWRSVGSRVIFWPGTLEAFGVPQEGLGSRDTLLLGTGNPSARRGQIVSGDPNRDYRIRMLDSSMQAVVLKPVQDSWLTLCDPTGETALDVLVRAEGSTPPSWYFVPRQGGDIRQVVLQPLKRLDGPRLQQ